MARKSYSEYYRNNRDYELKRSREFYIQNRGSEIRRVMEYYENNKEKILAKRSASNKAKPILTYRYETPDGNVAYVGSGNLHRAKSHKYNSDWWSPELVLIAQEQPTRAHARRDEYQWIIDYKPIYNKDR